MRSHRMQCKRFAYSAILVVVTLSRPAATGGDDRTRGEGASRGFDRGSGLHGIFSTWSAGAEDAGFKRAPVPVRDSPEEEFPGNSVPGGSFSEEMSRCVRDQQFRITRNYTEGKNVILDCFKMTLFLNVLGYMGGTPDSDIKFFNGLLELKKIRRAGCDSGKVSGPDACDERRVGNFGRAFEERKRAYAKMYKTAMEKLESERRRASASRNETAEEKEKLLEKIRDNSREYLSQVVRSFGDERAEELEEEEIRREVRDSKLLPLLDAFSRNYMLKLRFYPGVSARMMRSHNGGVTFDLEMSEPDGEEGEGEEGQETEETGEAQQNPEGDLGDEESTREIRHDGPQAKDYLDDSEEESSGNKKKGKKGSKKKKKEAKKKGKKLKKIIPYLLIPMMIQMTLLPFVFKKLFFLAMKALFAGKVALILVGFNLLRNTCIQNDDYGQKIRVEHYGYGKGEEYGAWINGRSLGASSTAAPAPRDPYWSRRTTPS